MADAEVHLFRGEARNFTVAMEPEADISTWQLAAKFGNVGYRQVFATKTLGSGITVVNAGAGIFTVSLASVDTDVTPATYSLGIYRINGSAPAVLCDVLVFVEEGGLELVI